MSLCSEDFEMDLQHLANLRYHLQILRSKKKNIIIVNFWTSDLFQTSGFEHMHIPTIKWKLVRFRMNSKRMRDIIIIP